MEKEKKLEYFKTLSMGFHLAFKAYFRILDYCGLDLVNFQSIKKLFRYKLYNNLKRIALFTFIISFIFSIDRSSVLFPIIIAISLCALIAFILLDFRIIKNFSYNENFYRKQKKLINRNFISIKILGNNEFLKKGLKTDKITGNIKTLEQKIQDFLQYKKSFIAILEKYSIPVTILLAFIPFTTEILRNPSFISSFFNLISYEDIFVIFVMIFAVTYQVYYMSNTSYREKKELLLYLEAIFTTLIFVISAFLKSIEFSLEEIEKEDIEKDFNKLKESKFYNISQMKDLEDFFKKINELDIEGLELNSKKLSNTPGKRLTTSNKN